GRLRAMDVPAANGATIAFQAKPIDTVTGADLKSLQQNWKRQSSAVRSGATGPNRALKRLRNFFTWAIANDYTTFTPFKKGDTHVNVLTFEAEPGRERRLEGDEEMRLLANASTP